jgi:DNA-binding FadR family transcriptional regulator
MSNDPVLILVNGIILEIFARHDQLPFYRSREHRKKLYHFAQKLGEAILDRDAEAATAIHERRITYIESRVQADTPAGR